MNDYIEELRNAILRLHGCESEHVETVSVTEKFEGKTLWQGSVEVFEVRGHPKATMAYAWSHGAGTDDPGAKRFVAVLGLPPVTSAESAVRAALVAEIKDETERARRGEI